ncbi:MAG: TIGR03009 domain-containing protein [Gemmataceae bacterium]|nr:TIGR03009 domain-containing protein [Gemmataceae bacterium]MDW8263975.1 TIGR03009 domain-containing protein [Gemmataceae bacterium]
MRSHWISVASLLLGALPLAAQQPAPNRLDTLLQRWEQEMKSVQTLVLQCSRTETDKVNMTTTTFVGSAKYMRPNLAVLDMVKQSNPQVYEKYVLTGTFLYEYRPKEKKIRVHELPPARQGNVADDGPLSLLLGMKAEEAKKRFDLRLVKEDQWYIYLEILPRLPADKADFQRARLVLNNKTFLPRELWFEQPNGNEIKWDIPKIDSNVAVNRHEFAPPGLPTGWTVERIPLADTPKTEPPPRIVRPNN